MTTIHHRAFTLAELLIAMAISATVMMGAVAAIGIGGRSFQAVTNGARSSNTMDGLARMSSDIAQAIHFDERSTTAIGFYVPDRTGDGTPDHLRYSWSGTAGDPITLAFNGSEAAPVIGNVRDMALDYVVAWITGAEDWATPPPSDSIVFEREYSGTPVAIFTVDDGASIAAIVQPEASDEASSFKITRVSIPVSASTPRTSDATVSIYRVDMATATPTGAALARVVVPHEEFPASINPIEVVFESEAIFSAGAFVAIVISSDLGEPSLNVPLEASPQFLTDGWIATTSGGGNWMVSGARDMPITIYAVEAAR